MSSDSVRQAESPRSFVWRVAAPSLAASLTLLAVAALAAVALFVTQRDTESALQEASIAVEESAALEKILLQVRSRLTNYGETGNDNALQYLNKLRSQRYVLRFPARSSPQLRRLFEGFERDLNAMLDTASAERRQEIARQIVDDILDPNLLASAHMQRQLAAVELESAIRRSQQLSTRTGWLLLLLGVAGASAGALAGFGVARSLRRQLVELSVPIRSAAGSLDAVVGPVEVRGSGGVEGIEQSLNALSGRVADVVQRLQAAEHESLRNDQLAALGQLAAGLAHELRNPLTAIQTLVEAARCNGETSQLDDRDLEVIDEELSRLDATLQSFLDYARPPKLQRTTIDLREIVERTVTLVRPRAEQQSVVVNVEGPDSPLWVSADREQLRQVLLNLLLNALDALGSGGRITVKATTAPERQDVVLRVADDGPGIAAEIQDRLFEPFASSKPSGTGLGLTICRRIVENHDGELAAENGPAGGAVFTVRLPADRNSSPKS